MLIEGALIPGFLAAETVSQANKLESGPAQKGPRIREPASHAEAKGRLLVLSIRLAYVARQNTRIASTRLSLFPRHTSKYFVT